MVAVTGLDTTPVVRSNVPLLSPAAIVNVAGTVTAAVFDERVTVVPPGAAGISSVTVPETVAPESMFAGTVTNEGTGCFTVSASAKLTDCPSGFVTCRVRPPEAALASIVTVIVNWVGFTKLMFDTATPEPLNEAPSRFGNALPPSKKPELFVEVPFTVTEKLSPASRAVSESEVIAAGGEASSFVT